MQCTDTGFVVVGMPPVSTVVAFILILHLA
jgi:hypothetical protein